MRHLNLPALPWWNAGAMEELYHEAAQVVENTCPGG
jgi:hypothetical protein